MTLVLFLTFSLVLVGCQDKSGLSGLAPCSGTVMMDGQPVVGATIAFSPTGGGSDMRTATAVTDAQGKFTMGTLSPNDGVTPGDFVVTIKKYEPYGPEPAQVKDDDGRLYTPAKPTQNVLPKKYESVANPELKYTISPKGEKNLEIVLTP